MADVEGNHRSLGIGSSHASAPVVKWVARYKPSRSIGPASVSGARSIQKKFDSGARESESQARIGNAAHSHPLFAIGIRKSDRWISSFILLTSDFEFVPVVQRIERRFPKAKRLFCTNSLISSVPRKSLQSNVLNNCYDHPG